ncbi:hypothetical protein Tco_1503273 [Tanacetum coccineum]
MSNSKEQTLADSGANERPPMLKRGNYIPWESRFKRFLDNKLEEGERMWYSIQNRPYVRPTILDLDGAQNEDSYGKQVIQPLSKMTEGEKKQYTTDVRVMNYLLQAIPNDIYNSVDACQNAKEMRERIKRLMFGSKITSQVRHSRLMDDFDKFATKEGESLESVYERLTMLVNIMDRRRVNLHKMISKGVHEHKNHGKRKTVINTSNDDQINSNIIFDDPYVESNGGTSELDLNDQDPYCDIKIMA